MGAPLQADGTSKDSCEVIFLRRLVLLEPSIQLVDNEVGLGIAYLTIQRVTPL